MSGGKGHKLQAGGKVAIWRKRRKITSYKSLLSLSEGSDLTGARRWPRKHRFVVTVTFLESQINDLAAWTRRMLPLRLSHGCGPRAAQRRPSLPVLSSCLRQTPWRMWPRTNAWNRKRLTHHFISSDVSVCIPPAVTCGDRSARSFWCGSPVFLSSELCVYVVGRGQLLPRARLSGAVLCFAFFSIALCLSDAQDDKYCPFIQMIHRVPVVTFDGVKIS